MPTELEELVEFLHHGNTTIRQTAVEYLVPYSETEPAIFKSGQLTPVKDLKLLVKDYPPIAKNALTILINISKDQDVLTNLATDDAFLETLLLRITNSKEPNANEIAMLLANMAKSETMERLLTLKRDTQLSLSKSKLAIDQLMDCFVLGSQGGYNTTADFNYLAYLFADLAKYPTGGKYLTAASDYDRVHPLSKLLPFSTSDSLPRRLGVSSALKNTAFILSTHPTLLTQLNILPYILLPLAAGSDTYSDSETEQMLEELQYLEDGKEREKDPVVLTTWLDALMVLGGSREGRDSMRTAGAYYVVRECHLAVEDEGVREACERLVQVLMRDEEGEENLGSMKLLEHNAGVRQASGKEDRGRMVTQAESEDEDEKIVEIF